MTQGGPVTGRWRQLAPRLLAWGGLALAACAADDASSRASASATAAAQAGQPSVSDVAIVIPSVALPVEVTALNANNNLDVALHDGRIFLAYRSAPWHFAHEEVWLYVISSADEQTWRYEGKFHMGTDLREPRLLSWDGGLWLYFAVLGKELGKFEPGDARWTRYEAPGKWSHPVSMQMGDFIPWRTKVINGQPVMIGYNNGGDVYAGGKFPDIHVKVLTSTNATTWQPAFGGDGIVLKGGVSEADMAFAPDGSLVAVGRNEAGDKDGFGSKVCTASAKDLGTWTCAADPKKYDSPLVFEHGGKIWLIGRRSLKHNGNFDLGHHDLPHDKRYTRYQLQWWGGPKRCALWQVTPETRTVSFVLDLPGRGDTCFASIVKLASDRYAVYNYTSPLDGDDVGWQQGQFGPTLIYRATLTFEDQ